MSDQSGMDGDDVWLNMPIGRPLFLPASDETCAPEQGVGADRGQGSEADDGDEETGPQPFC